MLASQLHQLKVAQADSAPAYRTRRSQTASNEEEPPQGDTVSTDVAELTAQLESLRKEHADQEAQSQAKAARANQTIAQLEAKVQEVEDMHQRDLADAATHVEELAEVKSRSCASLSWRSCGRRCLQHSACRCVQVCVCAFIPAVPARPLKSWSSSCGPPKLSSLPRKSSSKKHNTRTKSSSKKHNTRTTQAPACQPRLQMAMVLNSRKPSLMPLSIR